MGLNKETRDFFTNRINKVLDAKLEKLTENVSKDKIEQNSLDMLCKKFGAEDLVNSWRTLEASEKTLHERKSRLENETAILIEKATGKDNNSYYRRDNFSSMRSVAKELFEKEAMLNLYPKIVPEIEKIENIKEDVQGTVLLATTEPKLVETLTKVLNKYGGDISELLSFIPKS